jgi:hypothetical protein
MPTFCRHNRFESNCPICAREKAEASAPRSPGVRSTGGPVTRKRAGTSRPSGRGGGLRVRRVARESDDGFRSPLVPGIKASGDAERLAEELAFASGRLATLATEPPGLYGELAREPDREEAAWLAFLIAYLGPLDGDDPFAGIRAARTTWASGELPDLTEVPLGPRTSHDPARGTATLAAYRAWAERSGSQSAALTGEAAWTPERRFARVFERLALQGLARDARFDLLVMLGQLGFAEMRPAVLQFGGADDTTVAAKRVFGIGDTLLLERRATDLAAAAELPLAALDLGLWNWSRPIRQAQPGRPGGTTSPGSAQRATLGVPDGEPDADAYARAADALGL